MDINITLFLQAVQFAIAYFFLYRFLFAPAYKILYEQEQCQKELYKNIEQEQHTKKTLEVSYNQRQISCKKLLMNLIPINSVQSNYKKVEPALTDVSIEKVEISQVQIEITEQFLIDNLSQVRK